MQLDKPTITDLTNMTHNHTSAAQGGAGIRLQISADTTYTIIPGGGGDFTTIAAALTALAAYAILPTVYVTLQLADGNHDTAATITISHPDGDRIKIVGQNTYTKTLSSVESSGGRTADSSSYGTIYYRDYVLNLNDVTNVAAGDYILINNTSGGYQSIHLEGCHYISNVDAGNSRITCRVYNMATRAASGACASTTCKIVKSVIRNTDNSSSVLTLNAAKLGLLDKVVLTYDSGYGAAGTNIVEIKGGSNMICGDSLGITKGGDMGLMVKGASYFECQGIFLSANSYFGLEVSDNGSFYVPTATTKYVVANGNYYAGYVATKNASIIAFYSRLIGNAIGGYAANNGYTGLTSSKIIGNTTYGVYSIYKGFAILTGTPTVIGNNVDFQAESCGTILDNGGALRSVTRGGGATNTNTTITMTSTEYIEAGMTITGTDIPASTTVQAVVDETTITLSQAATGSHSGLTFKFTIKSNLAINTFNTSTGSIVEIIT